MLALLLALSLTAAPATPAPAAKPPAKRTLASLRKDCYGGPGPRLKAGVVAQFREQASTLMAKNDLVNAAHWFKRALRGGGDDPAVLRSLGFSLGSTGKPEDAKAANACGELLERTLPRPSGK